MKNNTNSYLIIKQAIIKLHLLSSLNVNLPIWANFLKGSKQMTPAHSILMIATWSCFTKRGLVFDFSPVFLSTKHMRACKIKE